MTTDQINRSVEKEVLVLHPEDRFAHYSPSMFILIMVMIVVTDRLNKYPNHAFGDIGLDWLCIGAIILSAWYFILQRRRLRMSSIKTTLTQNEVKDAFKQLAEDRGWKYSSPHRRAFKAKTESNISRGNISEFVTIIFDRNRVLVNSICNPFLGSWLFGLGRNKRNVETVTTAITEAAFNKAKTASEATK